MATAKAISATQYITSSLRARACYAVHIKIHPRPRNLAESREVLRVLQQYGEVVMFKHLKYEPEAPAHNSALAIYQNPSSAEQLINASPLRFELEVGKPGSATTSRRSSKLVSAIASATDDDETVKQGERELEVAMKEKWEHERDGAHFRCEDRSGGNASEATASRQPGEVNNLGAASSNTESSNSPSKSPPSGRQQPQPFMPNPPPPPIPDASADVSVPPLQYQNSHYPQPATEPEFREFQLRISHSQGDHHAYIERQGYYGGFNLDKNSIMAEDLEGRVPLEGMVDCQINKPEVPGWVKDMKKDQLRKARASLRQLWEEGRRGRGEI